jgi:integrase
MDDKLLYTVTEVARVPESQSLEGLRNGEGGRSPVREDRPGTTNPCRGRAVVRGVVAVRGLMTGLHDGVIRRGSSWSYVIRVTDGAGANKPRWVGGFRTEADAKAARDAARVAARRGEYVDRSRMTVETYLREWLQVHALEVKPKTYEDYRSLIAAYVVPRIGRMRLQSVRPSTLSGLYQALLASGGRHGQPLSPRTVGYVHSVLRKAFNDAVRTDQILAVNPAERAKRPKTPAIGQVRDVWDATQLRTFLEAVSTHRLFPFFRLAAYTGARRGELLHLRWDDVQLEGDDPHIRIRGSMTMVAGKRLEGTTKSGRVRTVGDRRWHRCGSAPACGAAGEGARGRVWFVA